MRQAGIRRSQIAQDGLPRSNLRRVTTRFFGKSVKTRKMADRPLSLLILWIFTLGLVPAGGCGKPTDAADGLPAAVSAQKSPRASGGGPPGASSTSPGDPLSLPGTGKVSPPLPGPDIDPAAQSRAQTILESAVRMLESRGSVSAKIRQQVDLFDRQLVGSGVYFEQRAAGDHSIRLELRIQVGDQLSSLLQVLPPPTAAGHYMWTYRKLPDEERLSRIDVVRATRALEEAQGTLGQGGRNSTRHKVTLQHHLRHRGVSGVVRTIGAGPYRCRTISVPCASSVMVFYVPPHGWLGILFSADEVETQGD